MVCGDDISLIIKKNSLSTGITFFHDNIVVADCYVFFTCICIYLFFFRGAFNIQASDAIYVWVMKYQSLEINYHIAPNNKSTVLPILEKITWKLTKMIEFACILGWGTDQTYEND